MSAKIIAIFSALFILLCPTTSFADVHAGDGAKIFRIETVVEEDIFGNEGDTIEYNKYVECDSSYTGEVCAGAYVYNDSLTIGDCVEMMIMLVEYSGNESKTFEKLHLKRIHACPGDNGKLVCTDPVTVAPSRALKAMIWNEETIVPYGASSQLSR